MALSTQHWQRITRILSLGRRRAWMCFAGLAVAVLALPGSAMSAAAVASPTLVVVVVGTGEVTSQPAGITCPGTCTATFAAGTNVVLTPQSKNGSTLLRWSGPCTGTGACTVKVSALTAVAAQFAGGQQAQPQPVTTKSVAAPGPYSGNAQSGYQRAITFSVAPGGTSMLNISAPVTDLTCTPSGGSYDHLGILQVAIKPDGSFSAKTTQDGVLSGSKVTFTYTFTGHFEAATSSTAASAAGIFREDVKYADSTGTSCTSN